MRTVCIVILLLLCTGCIPKNYIEQLGIITAVGYDLLEDKKIRGTLVLFQFDPTTTNTSQVVTSEANTSKGIRLQAHRKTSHKLVSGQVRVALFHNELASKGLTRYMDTLSRDAKVSDMSLLAVSDVPTSDILKSTPSEDAPNTGEYLHRLIEKSIKHEMITDATLTVFQQDFFSIGADPVLPLLTLENGKGIIKGLALFQDDRYVGSLPADDIIFLMMIRDELEHGEFQLKLPKNSLDDYLKEKSIKDPHEEDELYVSLYQMGSNLSIKPNKQDPADYTVKINMEARLLEITKDIDLKEKKAIQALEKQVEKEIEAHLKRVMNQLIEFQVDSGGFGKKYNTTTKKDQLTRESWRDEIPNYDVKFDVKMKILRYGITE
ncbi:Ger(x)C family spore germination protein [Halobacillus mangrovi]|uniref:Spore gernimation protein n=1 Tax=Halobacillus mangrovi TaxID=402384 RepID=A0A1W5ZY50_9BACI|nr:Ger(x)C family spore germination protein [Halobacillus mangrovi]ARI78184.1 spore gernimation protein [Halobacillus mangrovi]